MFLASTNTNELATAGSINSNTAINSSDIDRIEQATSNTQHQQQEHTPLMSHENSICKHHHN